jgi:hypothetical protein
MLKKQSASSLISNLKRKTRTSYSSEEKIRIIIKGSKEGKPTQRDKNTPQHRTVLKNN